MRTATGKVLALIVFFLTTSLFSGASWAAFTDIEDNWAREAIEELEKGQLFAEIWEGEFMPAKPLDHETALQLIERAFQLSTTEKEELAIWLRELFATSPEGITRGEFAALIAFQLGLGANNTAPQGWYPSFVDLSQDYPGFVGVEVLQRLALLPSHMLGKFEPYRLITRSEVAAILRGALQIERTQGLITAVSESGRLNVQITEDTDLELAILPETLFIGPLGLSKELNLKAGEQIWALTQDNQALLVKTENKGQPSTALWDTVNNAAELLADILTPAQLSAIISGDWEQLNEEVQYELYQELTNRGLAPWEAEALLKQDWASVQAMAQERLTYEAAEYLQVTPELIHAAITRNWPQLLEYAQVELAERILSSNWLRGLPNP